MFWKNRRIFTVLFTVLFAFLWPLLSLTPAAGLGNSEAPFVTDCPPETPMPDTSAGQADVSILMYHKITRHGASLGGLAITPDQFEEDLRHIRENGYHTVTMSDLVDFVHGGGQLPEKPIVLTFDDGDHGVYRYAYPLLRKYGMKAVVSVIVGITDKYSEEARSDITYPHVTWPQIREMCDSGLVEIQNHSYDLHHEKHGVAGVLRRYSESPEEYRRRLTEDVTHAQTRVKEMVGYEPSTFTYPFGAFSKEAGAVLRENGFLSTLICCKGVNRLVVGDPECLFGLKRNNRPHGKSTWKVFHEIEENKKSTLHEPSPARG